MPAGDEVTVPAPSFDTVSALLEAGIALKLAETVLACDSVTTQGPVPEHAPPQAVSWWPVAGVAVSVTLVPEA
ncbi:MAG: hypothetical protein V4569_02010 [Pseudomonadota bacterium]